MEPKNYPDFEESLRTIAAHYYPYGLDRYWVSNEPETAGWWKSGWDGYYRFMAASARAVKAADPHITINAPECWSYNPKFLDAVLASKDPTVLSVHYPGEDSTGDPHYDYYMTEMRAPASGCPCSTARRTPGRTTSPRPTGTASTPASGPTPRASATGWH